jgi:hypothetical protein
MQRVRVGQAHALNMQRPTSYNGRSEYILGVACIVHPNAMAATCLASATTS